MVWLDAQREWYTGWIEGRQIEYQDFRHCEAHTMLLNAVANHGIERVTFSLDEAIAMMEKIEQTRRIARSVDVYAHRLDFARLYGWPFPEFTPMQVRKLLPIK